MTNEQPTIGVLDEFQNDLVAFWHRLPNKTFFFVLLGFWLLLFQFLGNSVFGYVNTPSLFQWAYRIYTARDSAGELSDNSLGMIAPFIVLGLLWSKRDELISLSLKTWWPGLLIVLGGMALHLVGYVTQIPQASIAALFTGVYGLIGMAWGPQMLRRIFFPFFLFGFCIPFVSIVEPITFRLRMFSTAIVEWISNTVFAFSVIREGTKLMDAGHHYEYEVAAACSGIRSLMTIGLCATVCAFVFCKGWWRRGLLMALAAPLAVAGNVVRLMTIIIAAEIKGQAGGSWAHEGGPFGIVSLLPYVPAIIGLMVAVHYLGEPPKAAERNLSEPAAVEPKPAVAEPKPA